MRCRFAWITAIALCLMAVSTTLCAQDDPPKDPDLAADLKLLQGKWELFHRAAGEGPPNLRSTKEIIGNRETLRRYDLETGKQLYEHAVQIRLSKSGETRVLTFYGMGQTPEEGLSGNYKVDQETLYDIPGLLNGPTLRNYAQPPRIWVWKREKDEPVEKEVAEPRLNILPILDVAMTDDGEGLIVSEGTFVDPGTVYRVNLDQRWRGSRIELTHGCTTVSVIPSRKEIVSTCWDSSVRIHALQGLLSRVTIPIDRSATRADVSPDGKLLAIVSEGFYPHDVSDGRSLDLYDVETGKLVKSLDKDLYREFDVKFSPDGHDLALCGALFENPAGEIIVYDVTKGVRKARAATKTPLAKMGYSTDGKWIVATGNQGTIVVDAETAKEKVSIPDGGEKLIVLPRNDQIVFVNRQGSLVLAQLPDLKILKTIPVKQGYIGGLASRKDGEELIVAGMASTQIWNTTNWTSSALLTSRMRVKTGQLIATLPNEGLIAIGSGKELRIVDEGSVRLWNLKEFSANLKQIRPHLSKNQLGVMLDNGAVEILDADTGISKPAGQVPMPALSVLSADLTELIYVTQDNRVIRRLLNGETEQPSQAKFGAKFSTLSIARSGNVCCGMAPGAAVVLTPDANRLIVRILKAVPGPVACMDWHEPMQRAAVADENGNVAFWEVQASGTSKLLKQLSLGIRPVTLTFSANGEQIAIGSADATISLVSVNDDPPVQTLTRKTFKSVASCVWTNDDRQLLFATSDGTLHRINVPSRKIPLLHRQTAAENQQIRSACFNNESDECFVAVGRDIEVHSTSTWELKQTLKGHRGTIQRIRFSPDGRTLASTGDDAFVHIRTKNEADNSWRTDRTLFLPVAGRRLAWSPDGKFLAIGFPSSHLIVYETTKWEVAQRLSIDDITNGLCFSPDGKSLLTCGFNPDRLTDPRTILRWDTSTWKVADAWGGHRSGIEEIAFLPDNKTFFSMGDDAQILRWSTMTGQSRLVSNLPMSGLTIWLLKDPRYALISWHFGNLAIIDITNGKIVVESEGHMDAPETIMLDVVVSNDGQLAVSCGVSEKETGTGTVKLWRIGAMDRAASPAAVAP